MPEVLGEQQQQAQAKRDVNVRRWVVGRVSAEDLAVMTRQMAVLIHAGICLLYTSDAADALLCVDLGGRRILQQ